MLSEPSAIPLHSIAMISLLLFLTASGATVPICPAMMLAPVSPKIQLKLSEPGKRELGGRRFSGRLNLSVAVLLHVVLF